MLNPYFAKGTIWFHSSRALSFGWPLATAPVDEVLALAVDDLLLLLAHRLAQHVGLGHGKAGDLHRDAHHLLLIDDDAVGLAEDLLELGEDVGDGLVAVLAIGVVVDELHGTGTVQGVERRDIEEDLGLDLAQHLLHPR